VPIFSAVVHQSVRLKEAPSLGQSILRYAPRSQAAQAYRVIAHEIEEGIGSAYNFQLAVEPPSQPQDISEPEPLAEVDDILTLDASPAEEPEPQAEVVEAVHAGAAKEPERNWAFSVKEIEPVLQPSSVGNWVQRAGKAGDTDEAIRSLALAVEAEPANEAVRADLEGKLQKRLDRAGIGEKTYLAGLGQFLQEHGSPQYAERIVQQTAQLDPVKQAVEPWSDRPAALPEPDAPSKTDGSGMELVPVNGKVALGRAAIKEELKHQAVALVDQAVACSQSGDIQEAHSLFQQSVGLNPRDPRAWVGCARTTDSLPAKISFAKQALKVDPGNPEAQDVLVLASTFMRLSEKERWTFRPDISYSWIVGAIMLLFLLSLLIPMLLRNLVAH
jgi:tetratricopeptide (TPR) repeat protein